MVFSVGETVVYPHHGAALIEAIETRVVKGEEKLYLVLRVAQGDLTVRVPADLPAEETRALESAVERGRQLLPGVALVHAGEPMDAIFVVRSGSAKRFSVTLEGTEQVYGFVLPGEAVGLEGFAEGSYGGEGRALGRGDRPAEHVTSRTDCTFPRCSTTASTYARIRCELPVGAIVTRPARRASSCRLREIWREFGPGGFEITRKLRAPGALPTPQVYTFWTNESSRLMSLRSIDARSTGARSPLACWRSMRPKSSSILRTRT